MSQQEEHLQRQYEPIRVDLNEELQEENRLRTGIDILDDEADILNIQKREGDIWRRAKKERLKYYPKQTTMVTEFGSVFRDRNITGKVRAAKRRNKKSMLYQKLQNQNKLKNIEADSEKKQLDRLNSIISENDRLTDAEYRALASFMTADVRHMEVNSALFAEYMDEDRRVDALRNMYRQLADINISELKLDTDADIVRNAEFYESMSRRIVAFERLAQQNRFFTIISKEEQKSITNKLDALRSIAAYYQIRKEIIRMPEYALHYNDELSMNYEQGASENQKELAEKLMQSFVLGKTMMKINGVSDKSLRNRRAPAFTNESAREQFGGIERTYSTKSGAKEILNSFYDSGAEKAYVQRKAEETEYDRLDITERGRLGEAEAMFRELGSMPKKGLMSKLFFWRKNLTTCIAARNMGWKEYTSRYIPREDVREYADLLVDFSTQIDKLNYGSNGDKTEDSFSHRWDQMRQLLIRIDANPYHGNETKLFPSYFKKQIVNKVVPYMKRFRNMASDIDFTEEKPVNGAYRLNRLENTDEKWRHIYVPETGGEMISAARRQYAAYNLADKLGMKNNVTESEYAYATDREGNIHWGFKYRNWAHENISWMHDLKDMMTQIREGKSEKYTKDGIGKKCVLEWSADSLRQLTNLQLLNALMGKTDCDPDECYSFMWQSVETDGAVILKIVGVRLNMVNDGFSEDIKASELKEQNDRLPSFDSIDMPFLDADLVNKIMSITQDNIFEYMGGSLNPGEGYAFMRRVRHIQKRLRKRMEAEANLENDQKTILSRDEWEKPENKSRLFSELNNEVNYQLFPDLIYENEAVFVEGVSGEASGLQDEELEQYRFSQKCMDTLKVKFDSLPTLSEKISFLVRFRHAAEPQEIDEDKKTYYAIAKEARTDFLERYISRDFLDQFVRDKLRTAAEFKKDVDNMMNAVAKVPDDCIDWDELNERIDRKVYNAGKAARDAKQDFDEDAYREQAVEEEKKVLKKQYAVYLTLKAHPDKSAYAYLMDNASGEFERISNSSMDMDQIEPEQYVNRITPKLKEEDRQLFDNATVGQDYLGVFNRSYLSKDIKNNMKDIFSDIGTNIANDLDKEFGLKFSYIKKQ
ncbi:MAG: hypothetical protein IJ058_04535 [Lachnospiraceae bacterium]|nr:hypothetical protein [Lachnospiraceae bacterium]